MNNELSRNSPRLIELTERYGKLNLFEHSLWKTWADGIDITKFRGEHAYIAQMWRQTEENYQNSYDYCVYAGEEDNIRLLGEDGAFGAVTFLRKETGITFSRDLLDSVLEIGFIRDSIGVPPSVLDIGAGYGRLLHRLSQTNPAGMYFGVDAVPLSTFLCQFYMNYRELDASTLVISLDRILLDLHSADLAINCYSFSEMPLSAVNFWLGLCADLNIKYFFLCPHAGDLVNAHYVTSEPNGSHLDYYHLFAKHGYMGTRRWHKFPPDWSKPLIFNTEFVLFKRG